MSTATVQLARGGEAIIDEADLPFVQAFKWHAVTHKAGVRYVWDEIADAIRKLKPTEAGKGGGSC